MTNLRDVLLTQKKELERFDEKTYVPRDIQLTALDKDIIKVIIGPRRAGKSFFAIHQIKKSGHFGYVNFDDENLVFPGRTPFFKRSGIFLQRSREVPGKKLVF